VNWSLALTIAVGIIIAVFFLSCLDCACSL
jgi:hypothetical protein